MVLGGDRAEMFVLVSKSVLDNLAGVTVSATTFSSQYRAQSLSDQGKVRATMVSRARDPRPGALV